jgi:hypothetical protein
MRHFAHSRSKLFVLPLCVIIVLSLGATAAMSAAPTPPQIAPTPTPARVAYIYNTDTASRDSFSALLTGRGVQVAQVALSAVVATDFSTVQTIIIGNDTGEKGVWGDSAIVSKIAAAGKPIVGIGQGGYAFFGAAGLGLDIGYGRGALHITESQAHMNYPGQTILAAPTPIDAPHDRLLTLYTAGVNAVAPLVSGAAAGTPLAYASKSFFGAPYDALMPLTAQRAANRCHALWGFTAAPSLMTPTGQDLFVNFVLGQPCAAFTLASRYAPVPPKLDGVVDYNEWPDANGLDFGHGYITAVNDGVRLYLLLDVWRDGQENPPASPAPDYFWLTFDVNRDGAITNSDLNYTTVIGTSNLRYQYYLSANTFGPLQPDTRASLGPGFGCFFGDGSLSVSFFPFQVTCAAHRVWEAAIDLREIGAAAGDTLRIGVRAGSPAPAFTENIPAQFAGDFSNLTRLTLAPAPPPPSNPAALVAFAPNPLEVTQAIQTITNSLSLVADKDTVARVFVRTNDSPTPEPAIVYLYGTRNGADLPGSPLAQLINAPLTPDRGDLDDSANFILPQTWLTGTVRFTPAVARLTSNLSYAAPADLTFQPKRTPTYWIVPLNTGAGAAPNTIANSTIISMESYLKAVYPTPNVNFVQQPWQAIGALGNISLEDAKKKLNEYYSNAVIAWALSVWLTGSEPYALPDQLYGFLTAGGGSSDPTWIGGVGYVGAGFVGTSLEGTLAHEINHNLDRAANGAGAWGRHAPGGCGATGADPAWPYPNSNINEIGFDTRLPWRSATTVVPANTPDLMSYCQSGRLPTKWISPYRWQNLFDNANFAAAAAQPQAATAVSEVVYISGRVTISDTGALDPIITQMGLPSTAQSGAYAVDLQNAAQTVLQTMGFTPVFSDVEGAATDTFDFRFQMPKQAGVARVVLKHGATPLATIVASPSAPTVGVLAPAGGATISGETTIQWNANDGDPSAALSFNVLFSKDDGLTWRPLAAGRTESSLTLDAARLPQTNAGRIRVIATDGFHTATGDSATFRVIGGLPDVRITAPQAGSSIPAHTPFTMQGHATDVEGNPIPETQMVWSYTAAGTATPVQFGVGRAAALALPRGVYTVTLTAADLQNNTAAASAIGLTAAASGSLLYLPLLMR